MGELGREQVRINFEVILVAIEWGALGSGAEWVLLAASSCKWRSDSRQLPTRIQLHLVGIHIIRSEEVGSGALPNWPLPFSA